ncbi:hypothetical protein Tco_0053287 [Tanacetum coccineum]
MPLTLFQQTARTSQILPPLHSLLPTLSELVVNESNVEVQPKVWSDAPIIEEYESDSDDEYVSVQTKGLDTPSFANKQDNPHRTLKNKGIIDSGCFQAQTGNKAYPWDFQRFNGWPCLLWMLPDENQILLKVPRQNNMYSFNLENIVPSGGLACLIAKATTDEYNKWHRRKPKELKENLHINFLETTQPNVAGKRTLGFARTRADLDYLTDSIELSILLDQRIKLTFMQEWLLKLPIWHSYSSTNTSASKSDNKRGNPREEEQVFLVMNLARLQMKSTTGRLSISWQRDSLLAMQKAKPLWPLLLQKKPIMLSASCCGQEPTGENLGDHSSNDTSHSGNEDDMTLKMSMIFVSPFKVNREERNGEKTKRLKKIDLVLEEGVSTDKEGGTEEIFASTEEQRQDQNLQNPEFNIDPKDKGKKKIEEEDESESEDDDIPQAVKKFKQLESDEEMARKIQEEWEAEEERNRIAEEKATNEALIKNFDDIKARIEADRILAEKLQEQEREQFTIEERAKFLHDTIAAQRKFLARQRSEAIRNRPPTKNQLRNQMMTYLKHVGNFKHSELKSKKFEDIQAMYEKIKRSDEDFIAIGSVEDDRLIKRMNKKDSSKGEEIKQESKEEVKEEDKGEENTRKRKHGTRKKMKSRKRRFKQDTSQDDPSDIEKENDELRLCLTIAPDEDKEVDYEILDKKYPIIDWKTENLGTKPQFDESKRSEEINMNVVTRSNGQKRCFSTLIRVLSVFDREDLDAVYKLVMDIYQDKIPEGFDKVLWGDLIVMFNPDEQDEFWNSQHEWKVVSWKLHSSSGVHTLMTDEGLVVHMLIEKKYPLKKEILMQMLKLKLESEEESTMALELIRFIKKSWLVQDQTVLGKDYSNLLIADSLLKTIWFINAPCYDNEALASPNTNDEELSIPEQTATGKGTSNPLMAEEKACRHGRVFNWQTATYGKIRIDDDLHDLSSVEAEFPAIIINNAFAPQDALQCKSQVSTPFNDEIDFRISFDESDDEDYTIICNKNSFYYKMIYVNNLKMDSENDNEKVIPSIPSLEPTTSCFDDFDFLKDFENEFPAIVYNDAQTSKADLLTEPILNP